VTRPGWIAVLACVWIAPLGAQLASGELRLVVTDATGLPVSASGTLASDASQTHRSFDTGAGGTFTFDRLPDGRYRLTVVSAGLRTHEQLLEIRSALPREVRVRLNVAPLTASVTVTQAATLVDAHSAGVIYTAGSQQVRDQQSAVPGRELLDLVNLQPGWLMESNGVLHPRGSEYQTLFVVDGVPMDDNRSPAFAPELPGAEIEAVSVLTGTFPAEYGRKLGGVVDVTTSRDARLGAHGSVEAGAGSIGTRTVFASGAYGWEHTSLTVNAGGARTNRYLDPPTPRNDGNDGALASLGVTFDHQATARDRIQIGWRESSAGFQVPNDLEQERAGQRQDRRSRERSAQAAWSHVFSPRLLLNVRVAATDLSADLWSNPASTPIVVSQQRGFRREYTKASLSVQAGTHELKVGGDLAHAPVHEALQYRITDPSAFSRGTPLDFSFADAQSDTEAALFAQDTVRLGKLTVSAGLRWDRYAFLVDDTAVSPRFGVAWTPSSDVVFRFSYDRAYQTPAMENLLLASSPQVDQLNRRILRLPVPPSRSNFVEGGFTTGIAKTARLDATVYRRTSTNFADDDVFLNTGVSFPIAFRAADIHGADVKLTLPRWRAFSGFAGYSYLLGRADFPVTGGLFLGGEAVSAIAQADRVPITQDQRHTARARLRYQVAPRAWSALVVRYGSGLPVELEDDDIEMDELVAHFGSAVVDRVDFQAGRLRQNVAIDWGGGVELWRRDKRRVDLRAEIANLTNRLNVLNFAGLFSGTAVAPPRSANVRLRVEF